MTRYLLPKALGGGEVVEFLTAVQVPPEYRAVGFRSAQDDGEGWLYLIPVRALTEVQPTIPPEPEPGPYLVGSTLVVRTAECRIAPWTYLDQNGWVEWVTWTEVWAKFGGRGVVVVPLVPASQSAPEPGPVIPPEMLAQAEWRRG